MPLKHTVEELILSNGMRGLLIDAPGATSVHYDVHFLAGTGFVADQSRSQTAHIMEHLAFGPNKKYDSLESFSHEFTKNGAYNNARTSTTDMIYNADAALMEWDRILDLQELAITTPKYTQESLDAEKGNVKEELIGYATNHGRILWQEIMKQSHLKQWYDPKEVKSIDGVTLNDVTNHFKQTHTLNNLKFVFAGDLQKHRDEIIEKLENWSLEEGSQLEVTSETAHPTGPVHVARTDLPNLTFSLTFFLNRKLTQDEEQILNVLSYVLTGTFHSRIFGAARKRGICYGMYTSYESFVSDVTEISINGQVSIDNAHELFELIIKQLNDVRKNGISEEELSQAKEYRLGSLQMSHETIRSLVSWYSDEYYKSQGIDYINELPELIAKTTVEGVSKFLKELLESGAWTLGGIGNIEKSDFQAHYDLIERDLIKAVQ